MSKNDENGERISTDKTVTTPIQDVRAEGGPAAEDAGLLRQQINSVRTFIFIAAAFTFISAILMTPGLPSSFTVTNIVVTGVVGLLYVFLGIWARKKPYTAIRVGLLLLALAILADIFVTPYGAFNRWQSKLLTLAVLLLGFRDSRDAQRKMAAGAAAAGAAGSASVAGTREG